MDKKIDAYTFEEFISAEDIAIRVEALAVQLRQDYKDKQPVFIIILNGAFIFGSDLIRAYGEDCEINFVKLSSYEGMESSLEITTHLDILIDIADKDVVIIEDIIDTGATLHTFIENVKSRNPKSVSIAALLIKPEAIRYDIDVQYQGFSIANDFVIGYGLDYNERGRELKALYRLKSSKKA